MAVRYFTFGQNHVTSYELPRGGRLADYWVAVECADETVARAIFIQEFTSYYCPSPDQFAMEYRPQHFKQEHFPKGELVRIDWVK